MVARHNHGGVSSCPTLALKAGTGRVTREACVALSAEPRLRLGFTDIMTHLDTLWGMMMVAEQGGTMPLLPGSMQPAGLGLSTGVNGREGDQQVPSEIALHCLDMGFSVPLTGN